MVVLTISLTNADKDLIPILITKAERTVADLRPVLEQQAPEIYQGGHLIYKGKVLRDPEEIHFHDMDKVWYVPKKQPKAKGERFTEVATQGELQRGASGNAVAGLAAQGGRFSEDIAEKNHWKSEGEKMVLKLNGRKLDPNSNAGRILRVGNFFGYVEFRTAPPRLLMEPTTLTHVPSRPPL